MPFLGLRPQASPPFARSDLRGESTQNLRQHPPLALIWKLFTGFPVQDKGSCNAHFRRQIPRCEILLVAFDLYPISLGLYARRQGFRLVTLMRFLNVWDTNPPLCNTQQGYLPLGEGESFAVASKCERHYSRFGSGVQGATFSFGEISPRPFP